MQRRLFVTGSLIALLVSTPCLGVRAQGGPAPAPGGPVTPARRARRERHPELMRALRALQRARGDLQHANRDFGGHRAHAQDLTEQAIREVQAAIQFDTR